MSNKTKTKAVRAKIWFFEFLSEAEGLLHPVVYHRLSPDWFNGWWYSNVCSPLALKAYELNP